MVWTKEKWAEVNKEIRKDKLENAIGYVDYYMKQYGNRGLKQERLLDLLTVAKRMADHYNEFPVATAINYSAYVVGIGSGSMEFTASVLYSIDWWTLSIGQVKYDFNTDTISVHVDKLHESYHYVPYTKAIDNTELTKEEINYG